MTAQIEAFSRNRFDQSSAQSKFCTDNALNLSIYAQICFKNLELFWTYFYVFLWIISGVLAHIFHVVNASFCLRTTRVLSIRNCAKCLTFSDNKANTTGWGMIPICSIPFECPLFSFNGTVALKIKLNNVSIFSEEDENITLSKLLLISVRIIRNKSPDFQLSIDVNWIVIVFI